jgi:RNA polymerase sigma-70 factor (ECF subfamily)
MDDHSVIEKIRRENGEKEFKEIYSLYRAEFLNWSKRSYSCSEDEAKEIFQEVMVIFYENIISGKLKKMDSNVKTYLFGIGKNKIQEQFRCQAKMTSVEMAEYKMNASINHQAEEGDTKSEINKISDCLNILGDPCRSILVEFYYKKKNWDDISRHLNYKSSDTVKNMKYKCLKRLRKIYHSEVGTINRARA